MKKQRLLDKNLGYDTHVRDHSVDRFKMQNHESYGVQIGEIMITEPEPLFRQNMVTVSMSRGGTISSVAYPGAFIDPLTGNLHGTYEGPIPGQMVAVGFENGNQASPYVVNRYPYQGKGNTLLESKYINPLTTAGFDATDVIIGHFSGSYLSFNTGILSGNLPGSVTLNVMTDFDFISGTDINFESTLAFNITAGTDLNLTSGTKTVVTAGTVLELQGNADFAVAYTDLKLAFDQLKTDLNALITAYNAHIHVTTATIGPGPALGVISPTVSTGTPSTADMSGAKISDIKVP